MISSGGDLTKHDGPGPHSSGSPQSVHGGGGGSSNESTGVMAYDNPEGFVTDSQNQNLPDEMKNELDGGPGSSIQYHGSSTFIPVNGKFKDAETYITPQSDEANGYAFGNHRMENLPNGYRIAVRRKPGKTLNISDAIMDGFDAGLEPDEIISRIAPVARSHGFRYLYHDHPSFGGNEVQLALISLYPNEDLKILKTSKVYNKATTAGDLTKAAPQALPPSFWEEEMRRLAIILLPRLTSLALEGMRTGAAKIGIGFNYAIYSVLAEQWARDYTDQLLKSVRTTNEAVVGEILAKWIAMPGRTVGDLRVALAPYFGIKRADVIAITETTRALASGEIMAYQRAGIEEIRWGTNNDELVCPLCGPLHGEVRKIGEPFGYFKWRKNTNPEPVFTPPFHPNCRCGISPVVKLKRNLFATNPEYTSVFGNSLVQMNSLIIRTTIAMISPAWSVEVEA